MENSAIRNFLRNNKMISTDMVARGLYLHDDCRETIILELDWNKTVFVFVNDCGCLVECRTEKNTFDKYILQIPNCDYAEYETR